ncbi:terminase small subunit [Desulfovibrio sp. TomC]|uniref:terminase small subunit n=1 Tax=Desulfovibrio sp. TomC TaxID=1562888 RepID=UPI000574786E|nr:terminase small subunit [Desulfovibrio sp. TomC]KHK00408.1 Phage terminase small subunit [Desulfovibrio sp. TomC]
MQDQVKRLTDRQQRFVEEYLQDWDTTAAAVRAGYSERSARGVGARLRGLAQVCEAIEAAMAQRSRRMEITQDRVALELARLAFADLRDFVAWGGEGEVRLHPSKALTPDQAACVSEIVETPGKGVRVKLFSKPQALAALSRHLKEKAREEEGGLGHAQPLTVVTCIPFPEPLREDEQTTLLSDG